MAKDTNKHYKKLQRLKRRRKTRFVLSVIALVAIALIGGSLIALLIYLQQLGLLGSVVSLLESFLTAKDIDITFIVFWLIVVPVVLLTILVVILVRRRRFKNYRISWEQTVQIAIDAERQSFEAKRDKLAHSKRFSTLNDIVSPMAEEGTVPSLDHLCKSFRAFAADELHLYYTEAQIRDFVAGLAVSKILILQGMSGTGKTSLPYAFGEFLNNHATIIPVQPTWKERSDLLGYFNEFTKKYNETPLLRKIYEANGSNQIYVVVLDEMNMARVEYYFAEFLSLLEIPDPESRYLEVVPDVWEDDPPQLKNGRIKLPQNMWFVGTANNDDSTFAISDKVYDRAMIIDLETRSQPFEADKTIQRDSITYAQFVHLAENAQKGYELTNRNERRLKELDEYLISKFQIAYGNRIMRQIRSYISVYVACGGDELDALDDILCKKVLRKLTVKDMSVIRKELKETSKYLEKLFGSGRMPVCREFLAKLTKS